MNFIVEQFSDSRFTYHSRLNAHALEKELISFCNRPFKLFGQDMDGEALQNCTFNFWYRRRLLARNGNRNAILNVSVSTGQNGTVVELCVSPPFWSAFVVIVSIITGIIILVASLNRAVVDINICFWGIFMVLIVPAIITFSNQYAKSNLLDDFAKQFNLTKPV